MQNFVVTMVACHAKC